MESLSDIHKEEFINKLFYVKGIIDENIENGLINEVPIGLLVDHLIDIVDENIINAVAKYVTDKYPKIDDDCGELFNAKLFGIIMTSTNFAILPLLHFMSNRSELGSQAFEIETVMDFISEISNVVIRSKSGEEVFGKIYKFSFNSLIVNDVMKEYVKHYTKDEIGNPPIELVTDIILKFITLHFVSSNLSMLSSNFIASFISNFFEYQLKLKKME